MLTIVQQLRSEDIVNELTRLSSVLVLNAVDDATDLEA